MCLGEDGTQRLARGVTLAVVLSGQVCRTGRRGRASQASALLEGMEPLPALSWRCVARGTA